MRAHQGLASYVHDAPIASWVRRIAGNVAIDHLRRTVASPVSLGSSTVAAPETTRTRRRRGTPASSWARRFAAPRRASRTLASSRRTRRTSDPRGLVQLEAAGLSMPKLVASSFSSAMPLGNEVVAQPRQGWHAGGLR